MNNELLKPFIKKMIRKCIIFVLLMIVMVSFGRSLSPMVSNELALSQMQNSNETFVIMNTYYRLRPMINLVYAGIIIWFTSTIARDIYKFVKIINTENKKEN